jgi:hypothetical protein
LMIASLTALASSSWFYHSGLAPCCRDLARARVHQNKRDTSSPMGRVIPMCSKPVYPLEVFCAIHPPQIVQDLFGVSAPPFPSPSRHVEIIRYKGNGFICMVIILKSNESCMEAHLLNFQVLFP